MKITRADLLKWSDTASSKEEMDTLLDCLQSWVGAFPGDLEMKYILAQQLLSLDQFEDGLALLQSIILVHPEFTRAYTLLYQFSPDDTVRNNFYEYVQYFNGKSDSKESWSYALLQAKQYLDRGKIKESESSVLSLLEAHPENCLIAMLHLKIIMRSDDEFSILQFAKIYQEKWVECVFFRLVLGDYLLRFGSEIQGMSQLRETVYRDHYAIVAQGLWGTENPYQDLWPDTAGFSIEKIDNQILNDLQSKQPSSKEKKETTPAIHREISAPVHKGVFAKPVYVILTSRSGIEKKYGEKTYEVILSRLQDLATYVSMKDNWSSVIFIPDDKNHMLQFGLNTIENNDAWEIKLALQDLAGYFAEHDKKIGVVLIVGGDEIIPFHRLPNPTDDSDSEVLSDNPYAAQDSNYFVPEWAVGRFPDEKGSDPGLLLKQLRVAIQWHQKQNQQRSLAERVGETLQFWNVFSNIYQGISEKNNNYGYSTAIWQRSSISAFRPIGKANYLRTSPPYNTNNLDALTIAEADYAYFNLHGIDDSPNWYGQKDINAGDDTPDFPVALQPSHINLQAENPKVVFSEACYGAYIQEKTADEALSLRFLSSACRVFVGSTCIAYGAIYPPLIGADQLAYLFWSLIGKGYNVGDAYIRAKLNLVKSILRRQGYLDGEDQKTLLSFVLYGDPLYYSEASSEEHMIQEDEKIMESYQVVNDQELENVALPKISADILSNVKEVVKEYLPGIEGADLSIREKQMKILHAVKNAKGAVTMQDQLSNRVFLTYTKSFPVRNNQIKQYTRVTLDDHGKMIKLSVSK